MCMPMECNCIKVDRAANACSDCAPCPPPPPTHTHTHTHTHTLSHSLTHTLDKHCQLELQLESFPQTLGVELCGSRNVLMHIKPAIFSNLRRISQRFFFISNTCCKEQPLLSFFKRRAACFEFSFTLPNLETCRSCLPPWTLIATGLFGCFLYGIRNSF